MTTLSRLKGIELEYNDKAGTIEVADDLAGQNKTRVIADIHDRDYGAALVNAGNAFPTLIKVLQELSDAVGHSPYSPYAGYVSKARAALQWGKE